MAVDGPGGDAELVGDLLGASTQAGDGQLGRGRATPAAAAQEPALGLGVPPHTPWRMAWSRAWPRH